MPRYEVEPLSVANLREFKGEFPEYIPEAILGFWIIELRNIRVGSFDVFIYLNEDRMIGRLRLVRCDSLELEAFLPD